MMNLFITPDLYTAAIRMACPLTFASLGGILSEKSGVLNMTLEGYMLMGAFFAYFGSLYTCLLYTSGKKLETLPAATLGGEAASGLSLRCRQARRTCRMLSETEEGAVLIHQLIQEGIE